jgi:serine O-acetyltransferase
MFGKTRPGKPFSVLSAVYLLFAFGGLRAAVLHRLAHAAHRQGIRLVPLFLTNLNFTLHGFDMPPGVPVGPRFYIPHPAGTVVTARRIGANVTLVSGVTIGMRNEPRFPVIGNDVYIGAGARVLGGITIGDRVQIGANAVVLRDVSSDSVAVGVPAIVRASGSHARVGTLVS